jgi:hypothetical protein
VAGAELRLAAVRLDFGRGFVAVFVPAGRLALRSFSGSAVLVRGKEEEHTWHFEDR